MPKVKWTSDISVEDIEEATSIQQYVGKIPPGGIYRFALRQCKTGTSNADNPKLINLWILDGSWRPEHKKFDGCPLWDHLAVTKETAFRVKALCDALGVSYKDFMTKMLVDEEKNVTKIGTLKVQGEDLLVCINVRRDEDPEYGERLVLGKGGYSPVPEDEEDEEDGEEYDEEDSDEDDDEEL